jgi:hypothetical protein
LLCPPHRQQQQQQDIDVEAHDSPGRAPTAKQVEQKLHRLNQKGRVVEETGAEETGKASPHQNMREAAAGSKDPEISCQEDICTFIGDETLDGEEDARCAVPIAGKVPEREEPEEEEASGSDERSQQEEDDEPLHLEDGLSRRARSLGQRVRVRIIIRAEQYKLL